jgi:hypothetical protein
MSSGLEFFIGFSTLALTIAPLRVKINCREEISMFRRVRAPARLADDDGARIKEGPLPSSERE